MPAQSECPLCGGTGWKEVVRDGVTAVARCGCVRPPAAEDLLRQSGIPPRFENAGFDNFSAGRRQDNPIEHDHLTNAIVTARRFAADYLPDNSEPGHGGLLLQGPTGGGKTHLAVAVLRELMQRGLEGFFFDYQQWLKQMRGAYDAAAGNDHRIVLERAQEADVVLLDDLGSERYSEWVEDTITSLINHRYNARRAIIATTNLPIPQLGDSWAQKNPVTGRHDIKDTLTDRIGARAVSRLLGMCRICRISTRDYRERGLSRAVSN
jgi:DNA replication protein DnaC